MGQRERTEAYMLARYPTHRRYEFNSKDHGRRREMDMRAKATTSISCLSSFSENREIDLLGLLGSLGLGQGRSIRRLGQSRLGAPVQRKLVRRRSWLPPGRMGRPQQKRWHPSYRRFRRRVVPRPGWP